MRARPHLVEELQAKTDTADDAAIWAGRLDVRESAAPLRDLLTQPPERNGLALVGPVVLALAELDDRGSVGLLADVARRMESEYFTGWEESVAALRALGGPGAVEYAQDFLEGLTDGTTAMGIDHVDEVLPIVLAADARDVLPTLQALTSGGDEGFRESTYEALMGARLRLGDEELVRRVRRELRGWEDGDPFTPDYYAEGLGDEDSRRRLVALIGEDSSTIVPWAAARTAIPMQLEGAVAAALELAGRRTRREPSSEMNDELEGFVDTIVPALGAGDAGWTILLLDSDRAVRIRALHHLSRLRPAGTCDVVAGAVEGADAEAIEDALRALTVLDDACAGQVEGLARSGRAADSTIRTAIEVLAMMRSPAAGVLIRERRAAGDEGRYLDRAEEILGYPD